MERRAMGMGRKGKDSSARRGLSALSLCRVSFNYDQ